jgi:hypothetical protein
MESQISHNKECKDMVAWDPQVGAHHTITYHVATLEYHDEMMHRTAVPRNLEHSTHSPLALTDKLQEVIHRHRDVIIGERVE